MFKFPKLLARARGGAKKKSLLGVEAEKDDGDHLQPSLPVSSASITLDLSLSPADMTRFAPLPLQPASCAAFFPPFVSISNRERTTRGSAHQRLKAGKHRCVRRAPMTSFDDELRNHCLRHSGNLHDKSSMNIDEDRVQLRAASSEHPQDYRARQRHKLIFKLET